MRQVRPHVASLEEGVLRVLYEGPATGGECAAGLLHHGRATEVVTGEIAALLADLVVRGCITSSGQGESRRYALTATGSERLAALVEIA
jgi:DNA-binding PadR family transcriptional regulator